MIYFTIIQFCMQSLAFLHLQTLKLQSMQKLMIEFLYKQYDRFLHYSENHQAQKA